MTIELNSAESSQGYNLNHLKQKDIRFRCTHCQKLFKTSADVFDEAAPEFDCDQCLKSFILTSNVESSGLYTTAALGQKPFEACPKCASLKPHGSDECHSCGVLATKYLAIQKSESPLVFELNQNWQKVLNHFDEDQFHQDFINKCQVKLALNFAFQKYSELKKTMGTDILCEKYIQQITLRLEQQIKSAKKPEDKIDFKPVMNLTPTQWLFIAVGAVGLLMLIYNKFVPTFPNFNGLVMIFTVLSFGIGLFSNTKSSLKF